MMFLGKMLVHSREVVQDAGMIFFPRFALRLALRLACLLPFSSHAQTGATRPTEPALGTYHWPNGTAGVDAFATWLGRDAVWGLDFVGSESWSNVGWPVFLLDSSPGKVA